MTAVPLATRPTIDELSRVDRLLVTRRDSETRRYEPLGFLVMEGGTFRFAYLRSVAESDEFRPLPGLSSRGPHRAEQLFPVFAERIMSPRRPDRPTVMDALGLALDAEPFEVLARSGGRRVGDTIELVPVPTDAPDGTVTVDFFVHGVRHMTSESQHRVASLRDGETLRLLDQPDNRVEPRAVLVTDQDSVELGYVPSPLLDLIHDMVDVDVQVLRVNPADVGFHFRLLVRVCGRMIVGRTPFAGPQWATTDEATPAPSR